MVFYRINSGLSQIPCFGPSASPLTERETGETEIDKDWQQAKKEEIGKEKQGKSWREQMPQKGQAKMERWNKGEHSIIKGRLALKGHG